MFTIEDAPKFAGTQISVKSPGELSLYIKENEKYKIERLRILGPLNGNDIFCLLYTSPSPRDAHESRMPSSA